MGRGCHRPHTQVEYLNPMEGWGRTFLSPRPVKTGSLTVWKRRAGVLIFYGYSGGGGGVAGAADEAAAPARLQQPLGERDRGQWRRACARAARSASQRWAAATSRVRGGCRCGGLPRGGAACSEGSIQPICATPPAGLRGRTRLPPPLPRPAPPRPVSRFAGPLSSIRHTLRPSRRHKPGVRPPASSSFGTAALPAVLPKGVTRPQAAARGARLARGQRGQAPAQLCAERSRTLHHTHGAALRRAPQPRGRQAPPLSACCD